MSATKTQAGRETQEKRTEHGQGTDRQFRFADFTGYYEETVAFYRDSLGMQAVDSWNRSPDDRGTLISAAAGIIEVLAVPYGLPHMGIDTAPHLPPNGRNGSKAATAPIARMGGKRT